MQLLENVAENTNDNVWQNLKHIILHSSGFQRWQATQAGDRRENSTALSAEQDDDALVTSYLKDTLQTLAY
jgi:hypothetical protein